MGGRARGYDGAKRQKGRKRHILVDALGPVLLACVHAADVHDRDGARLLVDTASPMELPQLQLVWADQGGRATCRCGLRHGTRARRSRRSLIAAGQRSERGT